MTEERIKAIKKRRGNLFSDEYILQFEEEWIKVVRVLKESGADLSKISISGKERCGEVRGHGVR